MMITILVESAMMACALVVVISMIYQLLGNVYLHDWLNWGRMARLKTNDLPPVTFLRPLKANPPGLAETLNLQAGALHRNDQLVLGVEAGTAAAEEAERFRRRWPDCELTIVICEPSRALNPKIAKLLEMTPRARHGHWILADSEARLSADETDALRREWANTGAAALTCGYRFALPDSWPSRCDAAASLLTLWPGLALLRRFGKMRLTLGACTTVHRDDVEAVGGWQAFADDLAEDNRLGAALMDSGREVRLSAGIVTLVSDPLTWTDYWRHQRRVAVTYRVSNPIGFAGSLVTHGWLFAALFLLLPHPMARKLGAVLLVEFWIVRWLTARATARMIGFPMAKLARVVFIASIVETGCWIASWFSRHVWWGGRRWRISSEGKLAANEGRSEPVPAE